MLCLALLAVAIGSSAWRLRRRWLPDADGAFARLCEIVIALGLLVVELEVLGTFGLFRLIPIVLASVLVAAVIHLRVSLPDQRAGGHAGRRRLQHPLALSLSLLSAGTVLANWLGQTLLTYSIGYVRPFDTIWYQGPLAAVIAQTGSTTQLVYTDIEYLVRFYPQTAAMLHALGITLLGYDSLSPGLNLLWLGLTLLAAYCVGRPKGLGAWTMLATTIVFATSMLAPHQPGTMEDDTAALFFLVAAVAILPDPQNPGELAAYRPRMALAALSAGLGLSVKLTVVPSLLLLAIGAVVISPRGHRRRVAGIWVAGLVVGGSYWYLRNLWRAGSPLPTTSLPLFAKTPAAVQNNAGFSIAHYFGNSSALQYFVNSLAIAVDRYWIWILGAGLAGAVLAVSSRRERRTQMLGVVALLALLLYLVTPETAAGPNGTPWGFQLNTRYVAPGLMLGLILLPYVPMLRGRRARLYTFGLLAVLFVVTVLGGTRWIGDGRAEGIAVAAALSAIAIAYVYYTRRRATTPTRAGGRPVTGLTGAALAVVIVVVVGGYFGERHYEEHRYADAELVRQESKQALSPVFAFFQRHGHTRIAVAGIYGSEESYPLYGLADTNYVHYVARLDSDGSLYQYSYCAKWRSALNAGHYSYLVITPNTTPGFSHLRWPTVASRWVRRSSHSHVVMRYHALGQEFTLWKLTGPLPPSGCRRFQTPPIRTPS